MNRTRKIAVIIGVLLGLFVLAATDWIYGGLRFVNTQYDGTVSTLALCSPSACVVLLGFCRAVPRGFGDLSAESRLRHCVFFSPLLLLVEGCFLLP